MKMLMVLALFSSFQAFASNCSKAFPDHQLYEIEEQPKNFKIKLEKTIKFPEAKMKEADQFFSTEDGGCTEATLQVVKHIKTNTTFKLVYTHDDSCDGGNSFGYVTDSKDKIVGVINDSFIECK